MNSPKMTVISAPIDRDAVDRQAGMPPSGWHRKGDDEYCPTKPLWIANAPDDHVAGKILRDVRDSTCSSTTDVSTR